jgi:hypothetical protein
VALEKQPQREIRVVAVKENNHNAFRHYKKKQCIVVVSFYSRDVMKDKFQPVKGFSLVTL